MKKLVYLFSLLALAACGPAEVSDIHPKGGAPIANDQPLAKLDEILGDAPSNDALAANESYPLYALPMKFDVAANDSPVKSQGRRGVCSIFATVALMEHMYNVEGTLRDPDFSEQFLQWSVKEKVGAYRNSSGSNNSYNLRAVAQYGIPMEEAWPYEINQWGQPGDGHDDCVVPEGGSGDGLPTHCYTNGAPPQSALDAQQYKLPNYSWLSTSNIKNHIATTGQPVAVGIEFFYQAWNHRKSTLTTNADYWRMGFVTYPNAADKTESRKTPAGHAFLIVGWDDELEVPMRDGEGNILKDAAGEILREKGFYIFKNSWGTGNFGVNNPIGDGYGYVSQRYINEMASAVIVGKPVNVPDPNPAEIIELESAPETLIPDDDAAGIESVLDVTSTKTVNSVTVSVDIVHTYKGDLVVELVHDGKTVVLHDQAGGSADNLKTSFTITDFNETAASGSWALRVKDLAAIDEGTLNGWKLSIQAK